ncbi:ribosome maturation factor [Treponema zioleckii]|uniref:ribosome maturation factor n=1 Tax=Treponema zioleckii TaxID=331680 RepID=UPI00168AEA5D|nr:ribosome maturation factor [Treponema zioleckii]
MEYIPLSSFKYYTECEELVSSLGYHLVELKISPQKGVVQILAVITAADATSNIGVNDCSKVHRLLLEKIEALLGHDNTYMELTSPGLERNIKNAAEFQFFVGREIRVFSRSASDWIGGKLVGADDKSVTLEVVSEADKTADSAPAETKTVLFDDIAKAKFIHL